MLWRKDDVCTILYSCKRVTCVTQIAHQNIANWYKFYNEKAM